MTLLDELVDRVRSLRAASDSPRVLVGIAGQPGAGKTTLALAVHRALGGTPAVAHVPMDGFHLADVELLRLGRLGRKGAADTFDPGGYAALLARVIAGETVWAPGFERELEQPIAQSIPVPAEARIVISEGNYLLLPDPQWLAVRRCFDEVWYCREDEDTRLERLIARHVRFGKAPDAARDWVGRTDQHNAAVVAAHVESADLVVDLDGADLR